MIFTFFMIFLLFSVYLSNHSRSNQIIKIIFLIIAIAGLSINTVHNFTVIDTDKATPEFVDLQKTIDKETLSIFDHNRLLGVGLANWKIKIGNYHPSPEIFDLENDTIIYPSGIHHILLSETGILGMLFYLALLIFLLFYLISTVKSASDFISKITSLIAIFGLLIIVIFDYFLFSPDQYIKYIYISFFIAVITSNHFQTKNYLVHFNWKSTISMIILFSILLLAGTYISIIRGRSEIYLLRVKQLYEKGNWNGVIHESNNISEFFYPLNNAATPVQLFSAKAWNELSDPGSAILELKRALKQHPYHPGVILETIKTYELLDNQKRANKYAHRFIKIYPNQQEEVFKLCKVYQKEKDYRSAYALLRSKRSLENNDKYQQLLISTLNYKISKLIKRVQNKEIISILKSINANKIWLLRVHQKSMKEENKFEQQILLDCIFTLEIEKKIISQSEADELKAQYGLY